MDEPSEAYHRAVAECSAHHADTKTFSGRFLRPHKPFLSELIQRLGVTSALDYGCGKGEQYSWRDPEDGKTLEEAWGFEVAKFDPCWPPFAAEPQGPFDLVICTHVLGSIPKSDLPWVLERIFGMATKAVFIAEKIGPVKKRVLSDPEAFPHGWNSMDWLDVIPAYRRPGIETHLSFRYRNKLGSFLGRFAL